MVSVDLIILVIIHLLLKPFKILGMNECKIKTIKNNGKIKVCTLNAVVLSKNPNVMYVIS